MGGFGAYEGLVFRTAQLFAARVGLELEDMRQELRIKVVKAQRSYDASRSSMSERAYVYACLANFVKDLKRNAARDAARRSGMRVGYIEDEPVRLEVRHMKTTHEQVYGQVESGTFVLPSTITRQEKQVLVLRGLHYAQTEIALELGISYAEVEKCVRGLRAKLADWRPSVAPENGNGVPVAIAEPAMDQSAISQSL